MTATTTEEKIADLTKTLQYKTPTVVSVNPDRPNIFTEILERLPNIRKYDIYDKLIDPIAQDLVL